MSVTLTSVSHLGFSFIADIETKSRNRHSEVQDLRSSLKGKLSCMWLCFRLESVWESKQEYFKSVSNRLRA